MIITIIVFPLLFGLLAMLPLGQKFRLRLFLFAALLHTLITISFWCVPPVSIAQGYLALDAPGLILLTVISATFSLSALFLQGYFQAEKQDNRLFIVCLLFLLATASVVSISNHMGLLWVAIETTTLFSAPLISFHRNKHTLQATWRYLLVCSVGIAMALLGTLFMGIAAHEAKGLLLPQLLRNAPLLSLDWLKLSVIFLVVGYGCKIGLAPMHSWKPEAYGQATGVVAFIMAASLTQCSFLALLRVNQVCFVAGLGGFYGSILILTGALSLIVPAVLILSEKNIKRAFAYSSVEHMGLLVLGLGLSGAGIIGALLHMITNALAKAAMFLTAGSLSQKYGSAKVGDLRGVIYRHPVAGACLLASLLAGTAMFPFATFCSELLILKAAIDAGRYGLTVLMVICLAVMFIGLSRLILDIIWGAPPEGGVKEGENIFMNSAAIIALLLLALIGIKAPQVLMDMLSLAAATVGYR